MFDKLPRITYNDRIVTDLTRVIKRKSSTDITRLTYPDRVRDGESIEDVAYRVYTDTRLWWVVALVNNITEPFQWPLDGISLEAYIDSKYGNDRYSGRLFEEDGIVVPSVSPISFVADGVVVDWHENGEGLGSQQGNYIVSRGSVVTNEDYEYRLNQDKQNIRILRREYLEAYVSDFNRKARGL